MLAAFNPKLSSRVAPEEEKPTATPQVHHELDALVCLLGGGNSTLFL
jgi:hypothetical protein